MREDELDVMIRFLGNQRNLDRLKELRVPTADGPICSPCRCFTSLEPRRKGGDIERKDGQRYMYIKIFSVDTGLPPADLIEALRASLAEKPVAGA